MSQYRKRLLRRTLIVALSLGIMGYLFAQTFLLFASFYAQGANDPANQRMLWQTPLTMAGFGLMLTFIMEAIAYALRKKQVPVVVRNPEPPLRKEKQIETESRIA